MVYKLYRVSDANVCVFDCAAKKIQENIIENLQKVNFAYLVLLSDLYDEVFAFAEVSVFDEPTFQLLVADSDF